MHFVLSYDLSIESGPQRTQIVNQIEGILPENNYVRRLSTFYIVHVETNEEWQRILNEMTTLSRNTSQLNFIMSPLMSGGMYNGYIPQNQWAAINQLSR